MENQSNFEINERYEGEDFIIRKLEYDDYNNGFFELLQQFPMAEKPSFEYFKELLDKINSRDAENILVYENKIDHKLYGTISYFSEYKFIHSLSKVGHIEDFIVDKRHRNKSQGEGDEFQRKIFSWLNNKESANENNKKGKIKKTKNNFLNSNNYLYLNNNKILNINTINKNKNFMPNNKLKNTNFKAINNFNNNEGKNLNSNNSNDINISINKKNIKDNETIINHYHHPKFNSINIKKNKLFNYLSNPNIHKKNNMPTNKFPFIYNINTISNYTKNLLTININDSYSKDIISSKAINNHNNNFLTSNNTRQSYKNLRNIIVNNISPTVNLLIHSEEKKIPKKKKIRNEKRANTINSKENCKTITNNNYDEIKNKRKKSKKIFSGINQKY